MMSIGTVSGVASSIVTRPGASPLAPRPQLGDTVQSTVDCCVKTRKGSIAGRMTKAIKHEATPLIIDITKGFIRDRHS
jgi:hypothetical protein